MTEISYFIKYRPTIEFLLNLDFDAHFLKSFNFIFKINSNYAIVKFDFAALLSKTNSPIHLSMNTNQSFIF